MALCHSCNSNFMGNFCPNCGSPAFPENVLRCPRCNNVAAPNTAFCAYCGTALSSSAFGGQGVQPQVPNQPIPQQQHNAGKYLLGALGGAAAAIGGEILLHDVEKGMERHVERDVERREWDGPAHHHHHHRRRCACGHEFGMDIEVCPHCRRRWGHW